MKNITKTALLLLLVAVGTMGATAQTSIKPMACEPLTLTGTAATGPGTLRYQWYAFTPSTGYTPISGCATQNCTIAAADAVGTVVYKREVTSSSCPSTPGAEATITVHYQGMKVGSVCWAPVNVGAVNRWVLKPDDYGSLFQWNRNLAWQPIVPASVSGFTTSITDASWTVNPCPTGWRLPTQTEFSSILSYSSWVNAAVRGNTVAGVFTSTAAATTESCTLATDAGMANCIFLPAAGGRTNTGAVHSVNTMGGNATATHYWTSTAQSGANGYYYNVTSTTGRSVTYAPKAYGFSVRCVKTI